MKKAIIIGTLGVILVLGGLALVSTVTNNLIEKNISTFAAKIPKKSNIELKDIRYDTSLAGTTVVYTTIHVKRLAEHLEFKLKHEISIFPVHTKNDGSRGLGFAYVKSTISEDNFSPAEMEQIKAVFNNQPPVILETVVDYDRNYNLSLTINPAEARNKLRSFSGLNGNFKISKARTKISGQVKVQSLQLESKDGTVNLTDLEANLDQTKSNAGLWTGNGGIKIAEINGQSQIGEFKMNQASIEANLLDRTETLEFVIHFTINEINTPNGFPLTINSLNYRININNIDSLASPKLLQTLEDLQRQIQSGTAEENEQFANQFGARNAESIDRFLRANPHMTQNLSVATSQGPLDVDLYVNFSGFPQDQSIGGMELPEQLIQYISGAVHAKSPVALLQMTPLAPKLVTYQEKGFLRIEGDAAIFNAALEDQQFTINEHPVPSPLFRSKTALPD